jgi:hypothetical protein
VHGGPRGMLVRLITIAFLRHSLLDITWAIIGGVLLHRDGSQGRRRSEGSVNGDISRPLQKPPVTITVMGFRSRGDDLVLRPRII